MNIKILIAIGAVGSALSFAAADAHASPTFDCNKAKLPSEFAICDNPQLANLENQFVDLYYTQMNRMKAQGRSADRRRFRSLHKSMIFAVESCGASVGCISSEYNRAINIYINNMADH